MMTVAIDFDGTLVTHEFPNIGQDIGAFKWLKTFQECGAKLILLTMRSGELLQEAVDYCKEQGIEFYAVNDNPSQNKWTSSRKVFADAYIDDTAVGCPLLVQSYAKGRPYVDWNRVGPQVLNMIKNEEVMEIINHK